jgi:predicted dinucleotide-utilizing enzyme
MNSLQSSTALPTFFFSLLYSGYSKYFSSNVHTTLSLQSSLSTPTTVFFSDGRLASHIQRKINVNRQVLQMPLQISTKKKKKPPSTCILSYFTVVSIEEKSSASTKGKGQTLKKC